MADLRSEVEVIRRTLTTGQPLPNYVAALAALASLEAELQTWVNATAKARTERDAALDRVERVHTRALADIDALEARLNEDEVLCDDLRDGIALREARLNEARKALRVAVPGTPHTSRDGLGAGFDPDAHVHSSSCRRCLIDRALAPISDTEGSGDVPV